MTKRPKDIELYAKALYVDARCLMFGDAFELAQVMDNLKYDEIELLEAYRSCDASQKVFLLKMLSGLK